MTRTALPRVPFKRIKERVLGRSFNVSLAFVSPREALRLNRRYRKKTYEPNILTFPLERRAGEIVICPSVVARHARERGVTYACFMEEIFIHGLLHLRGHRHGSTMERTECRIASRFGVRK